MTPQVAFVLFGGLLQVLGLGVTARGAVRTWNDFSPNERLFDATRAQAAGVAATAKQTIRTLFRRPPRPKVVSVSAAGGVGAAGSVRVRVQFGTLDPTTNTEAAIVELDRRTREVMDRLHDIRDSMSDRHDAIDRQIHTFRSDLSRRVAELAQQDQTIATGGIKTALWGLVIVGIGVALQTVATLLPAT